MVQKDVADKMLKVAARGALPPIGLYLRQAKIVAHSRDRATLKISIPKERASREQ